ncbi:hypothetical protein NPIL_92821 [Nephila pilipes]|uniref:DUF5641 domain-containing protein n=1 Tax=Nephila pilipes TaxID=299642 RepID=A0A8X6P9X2_NEPPI|nr:hypothetical protein NPIL_92821 [Nephila pilipes]
MIRFCRNSRLAKACRVRDVMIPDELREAETKIMLIVQKTSFVYGHLRQNTNKIKKADGIKVGEIVLIEDKNLKRLYWPLGRVTKIFPVKDGITRLVKVKITSGEKFRPVQHLYSLELNAVSSGPLRHRVSKGTRKLSQCTERNLRSKTADHVKSKFDKQPALNKKTRLGREIKTAKRLDF